MSNLEIRVDIENCIFFFLFDSSVSGTKKKPTKAVRLWNSVRNRAERRSKKKKKKTQQTIHTFNTKTVDRNRAERESIKNKKERDALLPLTNHLFVCRLLFATLNSLREAKILLFSFDGATYKNNNSSSSKSMNLFLKPQILPKTVHCTHLTL